MAAGALIALGQLLHDQPDRDVEETTDRVTEDLLRMFGVPRRWLSRICSLPLPDLDAVRGDGVTQPGGALPEAARGSGAGTVPADGAPRRSTPALRVASSECAIT